MVFSGTMSAKLKQLKDLCKPEAVERQKICSASHRKFHSSSHNGGRRDGRNPQSGPETNIRR